jgi:hypothetical protein
MSKQYYAPKYAPPKTDSGRRAILHDTLATPFLPPVERASRSAFHEQVTLYVERAGYQLGDVKAAMAIAETEKSAPTAPVFARMLGAQDLCDYLFVPQVVMRQAEIQNTDARWDGVLRPLPVSGVSGTWRGYQKAASFKVSVFNCRDGSQVLESAGGLDIAFNMHVTAHRVHASASNTTASEYGTAETLERDYLANSAYNEEAIALAFHPFIPMTGYPEDPDWYPESR